MPVARALRARLGEGFRYGVMAPLRAERKALGWAEVDGAEDWLIRRYEGGHQAEAFERWYRDADVVVTGILDLERLEARARSGKLLMYMSERWWKPATMGANRLFDTVLQALPLRDDAGKLRLLWPGFARRALRLRRLSRRSNVHYLAMGYSAADDMDFLGAFPGRKWVWGYFAELDAAQPTSRKKGIVKLLWAGRMLHWKRLDVLLEAASELARDGLVFELDLVGDGPLKGELQARTLELGLTDKVRFHGLERSEQILRRMKDADIYVFPSSAAEGWGVVVNEALGAGAVVVASCTAGGAPYLVSHGKTGFLFQDGCSAELASILQRLIADPSHRQRVGRAGWRAVRKQWSPDCAAKRLEGLARALVRGTAWSVASGPGAPCESRSPGLK
ncbi:MAG: glycosyltransferase family 4 protein [Myxococcales bacterium]